MVSAVDCPQTSDLLSQKSPPPLCPSGPGHAVPPVCGSYPRMSLSTILSFPGTSHVSYHTHHLQPPTAHEAPTYRDFLLFQFASNAE